jgi:hypothetical protein
LAHFLPPHVTIDFQKLVKCLYGLNL